MWKNKEFRRILIGQVIYMALLGFAVFYHILSPLIAVIITAVGLIVSNVGFSYYRYREIQKLTTYLDRLQCGGKAMDIRDNTEGELSILKNEIYRLSIKLNSQNELLLRDKKYLADSLSDISHQLKTPLTSMMMMIELLEQDSLPQEKRREFLKNISTGIDRMQWLVQSLLKLSKLDAEAVVMKQEVIEVKQLIQNAIKSLQIVMEKNHVSLQLMDTIEPVFLNVDFRWTSEAINNIIKNCMEYTPAGGTITISYSDNNLYTKIVIEDTGSGIEKEDLPHIFKRFYKGKNSSSDSVGIGLALSKEIILRQKGKIEVSSKVMEGTRFELRFYR